MRRALKLYKLSLRSQENRRAVRVNRTPLTFERVAQAKSTRGFVVSLEADAKEVTVRLGSQVQMQRKRIHVRQIEA